MDEEKLPEFINYAIGLKGYEKGEGQLFLERLLQAFGNKGVHESGALLEYQIKIDKKTKFCDLLWPGKVLIEMKKRGDKLEKHFIQAKSYWDNTYSEKTKYVILCNFNEFWIYNWNHQPDPLDKVPIEKLKERWKSLAFLCPEDIKPIFGNNRLEVTKDAALKVAQLNISLKERGVEKDKAERFTLQCLVALFAEDTGLLGRGFFYNVIDDCKNGNSSYDLVTSLFEHMNSKEQASGGRFKDVKYFDGGIFNKIYPLELNKNELELLSEASKKYDWSKVNPSIFGNIFEDNIGYTERHKTGAHYTAESDIMRVIEPTILRPWREKIASAKTLSELYLIKKQLSEFKILDPACGSGNFLYVCFRELKRLELELFRKMLEKFPSEKPERLHSGIKGNQFYGIDINPLGIELAKITLSMAKMFAADDFNKFTKQLRLFDKDEPLPFDNLDDNLIVGDALFIDWPKVDAIIGNPPYQSKNKMQEEFGSSYLNKLREKFPEMPGLADYCVYWFRKAHDVLLNGGRAGLVGTNTIRETNSRIGGLDYITSHEGIIVEAVSTMPWSGTAAVHVSIVNWIKGNNVGNVKKKLAIQRGDKKDGPWEEKELTHIPSSLSLSFDVTGARSLEINKKSQACYQGQTHGHEGFLITQEERDNLIKIEPEANDVIFPYLIADELIGSVDSQPSRYVIDFQPRDIYSAQQYKNTFKIIEKKVLSTRKESCEKEKERNAEALAQNSKAKINRHHEGFFKRWWLLSYGREELISKLNSMKRYIVCGQVTKRPIFEFVSTQIRPNAALIVFPLEDDYSFGILQSTLHWEWFKSRCSTFKADFRYTSDTVFDSFPWPQWGTLKLDDVSNIKLKSERTQINLALNIAKRAKELRDLRNKIRKEHNYSLRDIYRTLELPGENPLRKAQEKLDEAVWEAYYYGLPKKIQKTNELEFLLQLNELCAKEEEIGNKIIGPGLPLFCKENREFFSDDCIMLVPSK